MGDAEPIIINPMEGNEVSEGGISIPDEIVFPFEKPINFKNLPDDVIDRVNLYLAPVIYNATKNREVDVKKIILNAKELFTQGSYYYDKDYWIQHCASSFREILIFVEPINFNNAHKLIPSRNEPEIEKAFIFLINAVAYLSSVVHHRTTQLMGDAEKLYNGQGYGQMNKIDFLKQEEEFFEHLCIDIIYTLDSIFRKYCVGNEE